MTGLLRACWYVYREYGLLAALRSFRCGWIWGREVQRRHRERMTEIADVNEYHRSAFKKSL